MPPEIQFKQIKYKNVIDNKASCIRFIASEIEMQSNAFYS